MLAAPAAEVERIYAWGVSNAERSSRPRARPGLTVTTSRTTSSGCVASRVKIRGLQRMVEDDKYCIDVLTQVSAATRALQSFSLELLEEHLSGCVVEAAAKGGPEADAKVREASEATPVSSAPDQPNTGSSEHHVEGEDRDAPP